jgi:hypothetical protein
MGTVSVDPPLAIAVTSSVLPCNFTGVGSLQSLAGKGTNWADVIEAAMTYLPTCMLMLSLESGVEGEGFSKRRVECIMRFI